MRAVSKTVRFKAVVPSDLKDLIPIFLRNRKKELGALRKAAAKADFEKLQHLSHRMRGVGEPYGFPDVSSIGGEISRSAQHRDEESLTRLLTLYEEYLSNLQISYGPRS